jgi:hypothetical protein
VISPLRAPTRWRQVLAEGGWGCSDKKSAYVTRVDTSPIDKDSHPVHPSDRELTEAALREGHVKVCALVHTTKRRQRWWMEHRARADAGRRKR